MPVLMQQLIMPVVLHDNAVGTEDYAHAVEEEVRLEEV